MALRSMVRSAMVLQPMIPRTSIHHFNLNSNNLLLTPISIASRRFRPSQPPTSCSHDHQQSPPQPPSEVSKSSDYDEWLALDQKLNSYPSFRGFTAIGTGGDDFVQAMVLAVQSVIQHPIPQGCVKQKSSSGGKYVSVNIGPIEVISSEQVQAVYNAMRRDDRMKYFFIKSQIVFLDITVCLIMTAFYLLVHFIL